MSDKGDALSASFDFQVKLVELLGADTELSALIGAGLEARVFASAAPAGTPPPYLTLGNTTEVPLSTFDKWGNFGGVRVDIWTDRAAQGNRQGLKIYGMLKRIFQGKQLALDDHDVVTCSVELIIDLPDIGGQLQHTQVLINPRTQQRAA